MSQWPRQTLSADRLKAVFDGRNSHRLRRGLDDLLALARWMSLRGRGRQRWCRVVAGVMFAVPDENLMHKQKRYIQKGYYQDC